MKRHDESLGIRMNVVDNYREQSGNLSFLGESEN